MYRDFANALQEETGIDVELDTTGTLYVGFNERDEEELRDRYRWQTSQRLSVEWVSGEDARKLERNLSPAVSCALLFPNDVQVENRRLIMALTRANESLGVHLISNCNAGSLALQNGRVQGVATSRGYISSPVVVIAAGAWTSLIRNIEPAFEVEPVRGQMLCFQPSLPVARHVIYGSHGYLIPRKDGRLLAGSTSERAGFEKQVTPEGIAAIKARAAEILPVLKKTSLVDTWAGFRPRAEDGLPVLGADERVKGLFFATGHYRNGILLAPVTAELIADAIVDGVESPFLSKFSPGRFRLIGAAA